MLTLFRIVLAPKRKPYRLGLLFTHENDDFGAIFVTEQSFAAAISKVERLISDRFCFTLWCNVSFVPLQSIIQDNFSCRHERVSGMVWTKPYLSSECRTISKQTRNIRLDKFRRHGVEQHQPKERKIKIDNYTKLVTQKPIRVRNLVANISIGRNGPVQDMGIRNATV